MTDISNYEKQAIAAAELFLQYDQRQIAEKFHLKADATFLYLSYISEEYRISRKTGEIFRIGEDVPVTEYATVMSVYDLLCHDKGTVIPPREGTWQPLSFFAIAGASPTTEMFSGSYAKKWDHRTQDLLEVCESLGGSVRPRLAGADLTVEFQITHYFPVLFQFWEGDEEFAPRIRILWDPSAIRLVHFETMYYILGDLLQKIDNRFQKQ